VNNADPNLPASARDAGMTWSIDGRGGLPEILLRLQPSRDPQQQIGMFIARNVDVEFAAIAMTARLGNRCDRPGLSD
jgi:hypothetical protein